MWRLVHETREGRTLVVTHVFHGPTKERAVEIYRAHLQSDEFLRGCTRTGRFKGIKCRALLYWLSPAGKIMAATL